MKTKNGLKIVCLGGGIGTVQILRGLRYYTHNLTAVVSMADDGGSAGRLRRLYSIPPPGDLINCIAALSQAEPLLAQMLTYRFKGNRWGRDDSISGQKLGNLILVALTKLTGNFKNALLYLQKIFIVNGVILPATEENVSIWAETYEGKVVRGEENIDLGKYSGKREIKYVHLEPDKTHTPSEVLTDLKEADLIIAGPGDLYTTILPVLLVTDIQKILMKIHQPKVFIVNIANKPFETPNYQVSDYIQSVNRHLNFFPFNHVLVNNNQRPKIPSALNYHYVPFAKSKLSFYNTKLVFANLVDAKFPLYHHPDKTAKQLLKLI